MLNDVIWITLKHIYKPVAYGSSTSSSITIQMQRAMQRANLHGALHLSTTILMDNGAGGAFQAYVLNDISQVRGYAMKNEW